MRVPVVHLYTTNCHPSFQVFSTRFARFHGEKAKQVTLFFQTTSLLMAQHFLENLMRVPNTRRVTSSRD